MEGVPCIYFLHKDAVPEQVRKENELNSFEVCMSVTRVVDEKFVEGAQKVRGLWKIYINDPEARALLLSRGLSIRHRTINLYDKNPFGMRQRNEVATEKVIIQDLPFEINNEDVYNLVTSFQNCEIVGEVKFSRARNPNGGWSNFKNGDRFCYVKSPLLTPLPKTANIGVLKCRIYHKSQQAQERQCKVCRGQGHKEKTLQCPYFNPDYAENTVAFRSPMIFSNFYACDIEYQGKFGSVEQAYQFTKASTLGCTKIAEKVRKAESGRDAKIVSKDLPLSNVWDVVKLDIMKELVRRKFDACKEFRDALLSTEDKILAEATADCFFGSGLSPELTRCTGPANYPGLNELGKIMMELRSEHQLAQLEFLSERKETSISSDILHSPNDSVFVTDNQAAFEKHKHEIDAIEEEIRTARNMIRTTSACRSSSVPVRKSPKDVSSNVSKEGIKKYLTQKRQASSSPVKDDTQFKEKQAKLQYSK